MIVYIYALADPFTKEIRYVGKSQDPKFRLACHCNDRSRTWKCNWIRSVIRRGARPLLVVIETVPEGGDWKEAERAWIAVGREAGWPLTNCTSGGDGVPDLPPEIRARISATWQGRKHRPESLVKIGRASSQRRWTEERRSKMRARFTGRQFSDEWRAKLRRSISKLSNGQVIAIRRLLTEGVSQYEIARRFDIHQGTVSNIKRGICYQHVTEEAAEEAA